MLNRSEERVKLLRKGFTQKQIEKLYIKENNFKIVNPTLLFELFEIDVGNIRKMPEKVEAAVDSAQSLCADVVNLCDISQFSGLLCELPNPKGLVWAYRCIDPVSSSP